MRFIAALLLLIVLAVAAAAAFIYSGIYNIAADTPHTGLTTWVLHTVMEQSVRRRAADIDAPPLDDPTMVETGLHHYKEMCVTCHGAPGVRPSELGQGLNPEPPDLAQAAQRWTPAELFWIVQNGIKMTGMPAWGGTHSEDDLWGIVAFLNRLPGLSPIEYATMVSAIGDHEHGEDNHGHDHPH